MAFPWGGSMTHKELAEKFGWPSVIISIILLPLLLLWSKLLAFPVWISMFVKSGPVYTTKALYNYPGKDDLVFDKVYTTSKPTTGIPTGWNSHMDIKGGKFFESFWGLIQVLDMEYISDPDNRRAVISPTFLTWLVVTNVFVEFPKAPVYEHRVRFYFPLDGPNAKNPFTTISIAFAGLAINYFNNTSFVPFKEANGLTATVLASPPEEDQSKIRPDGSMIYEKSDDKKSN